MQREKLLAAMLLAAAFLIILFSVDHCTATKPEQGKMPQPPEELQRDISWQEYERIITGIDSPDVQRKVIGTIQMPDNQKAALTTTKVKSPPIFFLFVKNSQERSSSYLAIFKHSQVEKGKLSMREHSLKHELIREYANRF